MIFIYKKLMFKFLKVFLGLMVLYHILVTVVIYWIFGWESPQLPALIRDGIRILFFAIIFLTYRKEWKDYFLKRKRPWILFAILMIRGVLISLWMDKSISDILIWIKYGFFYIFIFLSASFLWFVSKDKIKNIQKFGRIWYLLMSIVLLGFVWQWAKLIWPEFFMNIWYGPLNDFFFGKNPPIYYLTGYEWTLRWQWLFAGPNNYGYFLIAFLPIVLLSFKVKINKWKEIFNWKNKQFWNLTLMMVWILAILFTLSRTAILWWAFVFILLNINWIKKNKIKSSIIILMWIIWIIVLSLLKDTSTINHILAKFGSVNQIIQTPMWMWLGTAWPAIHHNGTILPENYFIQIIIEVGTIWFILRALIRYAVIDIEKKIKKYWTENINNIKSEYIFIIRKYLNIGRLSLLIMWIFLHVFEDSMVNYMFFISYWLINWYLSKISNNKHL